MKCLSGKEPGWEGVWVDNDVDRKGCVYAYEEEHCKGNPGGIPLTGSGKSPLSDPIDQMSDHRQKREIPTFRSPTRALDIAEGLSNSAM